MVLITKSVKIDITNIINGTNAAVTGGINNTANGVKSFIGGGEQNITQNFYSCIGSGYYNSATSHYAFVGSGDHNTASGLYSFIGSGYYNTASGSYSAISGGLHNNANGNYSTINGGYYNTINSSYSTIDGYQVLANKTGQYAHSSSSFKNDIAGGSQFSRVVYNTVSTNAASVNFTDMLSGEYTLTASTNYLIRLSVNAAKTNGAGMAAFIHDIMVSVTSGSVATLIGDNEAYVKNDPGYGGITVSIASGPILRVSFVGIAGQTVRAVATFEATELGF